MEPLLEVAGLCKPYPARSRTPLPAVRDVSFCLRAGETLGLVGGSGCGKTTLARLIARLAEADAGRILLQGQDITRLRGRALRPVYRRVQMVFQAPAASFDARHTLGWAVAEPLANAGVPRAARRAQAAQLLERCGLPAGFAARYPRQVSGGQCQRAALARALAAGPRLLICDEATSALDPLASAQLLELLDSLRRQNGLAILFICHDLALVQRFCDRALVMQDGRIVEQGAPTALIAAPRHPYTRRLVEAAL